MKKYFVFGTIASALCLYNTGANAQICPAGCFCISGGSFIPQENMQPNYYTEVCSQVHASTPKPVPMNMAGCGRHLNAPQVLIAKDHNQNADYYFDEFSEFYDGGIGDFYGFINGVFTSCPLDGNNISSCPSKYPYSDTGANSLNQCYKYDENCNKKYFKKRPVVPKPTPSSATKSQAVSARTARAPKKIIYKEVIFDEMDGTIDEEYDDFEM